MQDCEEIEETVALQITVLKSNTRINMPFGSSSTDSLFVENEMGRKSKTSPKTNIIEFLDEFIWLLVSIKF